MTRLLEGRPVQARRIGTVTDTERLELQVDGRPILNLERAQLVAPYETAIPSRMPTV